MRARTVVAASALVVGVTGGVAAVSSPAWAACGVSAAPVTAGLVATGTRSGCAGSTVDFQVRFSKDVTLLPDLYIVIDWRTFQNGTLSVTGNCSAGRGSYYTYVLVNGSGVVESPRRDRCY
jgi:hypothetical protein